MKSKTFILECLIGENTEVFMLRNGKGQIVKATQDVEEFLDYLRHSDEIEKEKEDAANALAKGLEDD